MPIVIGDRERMYRLGHELRSRGLWVAPVDYPAVPQDRICFRACVTAKHTRADLDEALNILEDTLVPRLWSRKTPNGRFDSRLDAPSRDASRFRPWRQATRRATSKGCSTSISIARSAYRLALLFARLRMTPAQVTLFGAALGVTAGHFYYYVDLR